MPDPFAGYSDSASGPSTRATAVVPSDANDLTSVPKALYVGVGGDITMVGTAAPDGAPGVLWKAVPSGTILPFRPRRVLATGTTATGIVALY